MAREYTVTVGGEQFRGTTANARSQMEAMHLALRTGLITAAKKEDPSEMALVAAFGSVAYEDVQKLVSLLVEGSIKRHDDVPVAENLFADHIQDYYLLIMHALRENVGPFWQLRRRTGAEAAESANS